jgi:hypothetical protein
MLLLCLRTLLLRHDPCAVTSSDLAETDAGKAEGLVLDPGPSAVLYVCPLADSFSEQQLATHDNWLTGWWS